jgi:NAD(P)H-dependent FMN reductase
VAQWFLEQVEKHGGFTIDWADLAEINLPFMDEPKHPRFHDYQHQHTKDWSRRVDAADAFVFVTPEYNYGLAAPLKNAIDYLNVEWGYKPVGFVSYGGVAAGARSVQMTKQVVTTLRMYPLFEAVMVPFVIQLITPERTFKANDTMVEAADAMLNELARLEEALRPLRKRLYKPAGESREVAHAGKRPG